MVVYFLKDSQPAISFSLQDHQDGNIEFYVVLGLRVVPIEFAFVFALGEFVHFFEAVEGGLLASIGHVFADVEVGLIAIDVGLVGCEVALLSNGYFNASLYFPALKFW